MQSRATGTKGSMEISITDGCRGWKNKQRVIKVEACALNQLTFLFYPLQPPVCDAQYVLTSFLFLSPAETCND